LFSSSSVLPSSISSSSGGCTTGRSKPTSRSLVKASTSTSSPSDGGFTDCGSSGSLGSSLVVFSLICSIFFLVERTRSVN